ncbi:MAG: hypothetical protein WCX96_03925, partial [Bacilli bacterium]
MDEIYKTVLPIAGTTRSMPCSFNGSWDIAEITQIQQDFDEGLNTFLEENNIEMDEDGNFEAYIVEDVDDEDCHVGNVVCNKDTFAYSEENAY